MCKCIKNAGARGCMKRGSRLMTVPATQPVPNALARAPHGHSCQPGLCQSLLIKLPLAKNGLCLHK